MGESGAYVAKLSPESGKGLKPKQRLQTAQFQELCAYLVSKVSYRTAIDILQRTMHLSGDEIPKKSTYEEQIESVGASLNDAIEKITEAILSSYGIDSTGIVTENASIPSSIKEPSLPPEKSEAEIRLQIREFNRGRETGTKIRYGNLTRHI